MIEQTEPFDAASDSASSISIQQRDAISARRRSVFWRRAIGALIGIVIVIGIVFRQRSKSLTDSCNSALQAYARVAVEEDLSAKPTVLVEADWASFDAFNVYGPGHYQLIAKNWMVTPNADQAVPLAVCGTAHGFLTAGGRHVLFNTPDGYLVRWVPEDQAKALVKEAGK